MEQAYTALGLGKPTLIENVDSKTIPKVNLKPLVSRLNEKNKRKNVETMWPGFGPSPLEPEFKARVEKTLADMNRFDSCYMRSNPVMSENPTTEESDDPDLNKNVDKPGFRNKRMSKRASQKKFERNAEQRRVTTLGSGSCMK